MKPKYEKMIDEYVKKHYGDLERGVLAPEVKYKVLTKILKKKLKEKKVQVKILRRLLQGKKEIASWAPSPDKILPKEDGFNHLAEGFKKFFDLHEVCGNCIHFREGKGKDKSVCAKHDKFVTETCSCYEFEDKESSYLDWLHDDITWCCRECSNMGCERNSRNRRCKKGLYSVADMFDPFRCPVDAELPEVKKK